MGAYYLLRETAKIFLERAPQSTPPAEAGRAIGSHPGVVDAHNLHIWTVASGFPTLSVHVLVYPDGDCHRVRLELKRMPTQQFRIEHATLPVEHVGVDRSREITRRNQ